MAGDGFFLPRLGAAAIALGAIVAPPDAVAANEVLRHLRIPQRIGLVLQGESMLNDATADPTAPPFLQPPVHSASSPTRRFWCSRLWGA